MHGECLGTLTDTSEQLFNALPTLKMGEMACLCGLGSLWPVVHPRGGEDIHLRWFESSCGHS